jgi:hypothetical protein
VEIKIAPASFIKKKKKKKGKKKLQNLSNSSSVEAEKNGATVYINGGYMCM